jgi:hypothetical protein
MPQCLFKFRESKLVTCGKQLGWLDALAGLEEFLAHLTHRQAYQKGGHNGCLRFQGF